MILSGTIISLQISVYQTFRLFQCCKKSNKGIPDMSTKTTIKFVSLIRFLNTKICKLAHIRMDFAGIMQTIGI